MTRQAVEQEHHRLADNHHPRPCIEDVTNVEGLSVDGAGQGSAVDEYWGALEGWGDAGVF